MTILLIGPKGAGKSTLREYLEQRGFQSVYMEALYNEFDPKKNHTVDKPSEVLRDEVYQEAMNRILRFGQTGNVVFDGTGSSPRFDAMYQAIREKTADCVLVFVDCERDVAFQRTQNRNVSEHRPFDRAYFDKIYDDCQPRKILADFVILNNKSREDFIDEFREAKMRKGFRA